MPLSISLISTGVIFTTGQDSPTTLALLFTTWACLINTLAIPFPQALKRPHLSHYSNLIPNFNPSEKFFLSYPLQSNFSSQPCHLSLHYFIFILQSLWLLDYPICLLIYHLSLPPNMHAWAPSQLVQLYISSAQSSPKHIVVVHLNRTLCSPSWVTCILPKNVPYPFSSLHIYSCYSLSQNLCCQFLLLSKFYLSF